jgi:hypothetical protein
MQPNEKDLLKAEAAKFFTRPFNLEHAKAGAPYACRNGKSAEILKWGAKNPEFPLAGIYDAGWVEQPNNWTSEGSASITREPRDADLVMTPLGYIDGKPVFMGNTIIGENGNLCEVVNPDFPRWDKCRWPEPEKQYPVTGMTGDELVQSAAERLGVVGAKVEVNFGNYSMRRDLRTDDDIIVAIANAALRDAVDNEQVVPMAEVLQLARELRKNEFDQVCADRDARDMAIAEAVLVHVRGWIARPDNVSKNGARIIHELLGPDLDLAAIVSKVQP